MGGSVAPKQFTPPGALGSVPSDVMNPSLRAQSTQAQGFDPAALAPTNPIAATAPPVQQGPDPRLMGYDPKRPRGAGGFRYGRNALEMSAE
jgi:hypothetical protein